jgi:hypothetical protein
MPQIIHAAASAHNPNIIQVAKDNLQVFAATVLVEAAIVAPTAGYKAYNKRVAFANLALHNPAPYAYQAAVLIEQISNGSVQEAQNSNALLYNYILQDNPSGKPLFEADANQRSNISHVGRTAGTSIFDVLAGVNQLDLI